LRGFVFDGEWDIIFNMKKFLLFLISLVIGGLLFIWVIKLVGWQEIKRAFLVFTGWHGLAVFSLTFLLALAVTWKWKVILKGEEVDISFLELFRFYLAGFSLTYLFPMIFWGGETFRAYLLKRKNSVSWSKGMASVIIDRIFDWTTNLIIVFFGIIFFVLTIGLPPKKLAIIFGGTFILWFLAVSFFYFKVFRRESLAKFFLNLANYKTQNSEPLEVEKELFNFFKIKKISLWKGIGLAFFEELINFIRIWFLVLFFGKNISFLPILSIDGFSYLATMIPISASLGTYDMIQTFAFSALGLGANFGAAFALIIRGAEIILALIGAGFLLRLGVKLFEIDFLKNEI